MFDYAPTRAEAYALRDYLIEGGATSARIVRVADGYLVLWTSGCFA